MHALVVGFIVSAAATLPAIAAPNATVAAAIDGFIRPAYQNLERQSDVLETAMRALCADPNEPSLAAARGAFHFTVRYWSAVEAVRFGPVTEDNRLDRILFWPDRKSIGLKQVQAAIAEKDATALDPTTLANKSVAMQGLGGLEFVLFGTGADELLSKAGAYRCGYGQAISGNIHGMAAAINKAWRDPDGIARQWSNPGPENPLYRTDDEAMTELFNVFVHGLEMVRDVRMNGFLGKAQEDDKPKQAIYWRSDATVTSLRYDLSGLRELLDASGLVTTLDADNAWIGQSIAFEFGNAEKVLADLDTPRAEILADPVLRKKLDYARIVTSSLSELFGVKLAGALGLSAGFSSLDGD